MRELTDFKCIIKFAKENNIYIYERLEMSDSKSYISKYFIFKKDADILKQLLLNYDIDILYFYWPNTYFEYELNKIIIRDEEKFFLLLLQGN